MKIFNIFSVTEPFKTAASGSGIGIPYTIQYNMSVMGTELDGTRYIRNYGKGGNSFNAEAFASNHIYLTGTQNAPYAITSGIEVCYYDVATKAFVKDTASNPYTMTTSHSSLFSSTIVLTDADLAELTSDPNKLYRIWNGSETLSSGFDKANIGNFYGGTEGLVSGKYVQDLSVDLSAELAGDYVSDITGTATTLTEVGGTRTVRYAIDGAGTSSTRPILRFNTSFVAGKIFIVEVDMDVISGTPFLSYYIESGVGGNRADFNATASGKYTDLFLCDGTSSTGDMYFDETYGAFDVDITLSVKELIGFVEIQDYSSACKTTLDNQKYGTSNLKLIRDGSGRTTGTAAANITQWKADGRTAVTNWTITAPFTITEIIDGDTYTFTSDGNRYKNAIADGTYTLPTGIWTLDEFGFDGVTSVTARGVTRMIDEVVIP